LLIIKQNPEKLVSAVNDLLDDKKRAEKLAKAGYDFVINNLTWEVLLPRHKKF